jgi:hypothetical protein
MKKSLFALILVTMSFSAHAQGILSDSARISLLTCGPWSGAVYAFYGHTALRVQDDSTGIDVVFNYGYFDPSQPNFVYRFMRGETDYILGATPFETFIEEYIFKRVSVHEQELNLSQAEKQRLWEALYINHLPENRGYRYNYFYDNCATRPRDMVEQHAGGTILYPPMQKEQTYRDLLHECLSPYPWNKFGVDLVIGAEADRPIDVRARMFIPSYLKESFEGATVVKSDSVSYPLVKSTTTLLTGTNQARSDREQALCSPLIAAFALLLITIIISAIQYVKWNKSRIHRVFDTILFGVYGLGGLIIFFLIFFSEHPATNPNWNFAWLNIFSLVAAVLFWVKAMKNVVNIYHFINFAVLTLFLLLWWLLPQQLPLASIPFSMCLWLRSGMNLFMQVKGRKINKRYVSSKYMKAGWGE